jgi:hypothetical protein
VSFSTAAALKSCAKRFNAPEKPEAGQKNSKTKQKLCINRP